MNPFLSSAAALVGGVISGAVVAARSAGSWAIGVAPQKVELLSARRLRAIAAVGEVVPSRIGDAKFSKLAPGYKRAAGPDGSIVATAFGVKLPKGFTGCGYLPCYVGRALGDPRGITWCGLEQARINAKKQDAWVEAGGDARPKPGDILLYVNSINIPSHIGMFIGFNEDGTWKTADGGQTQGIIEEALYRNRKYDPENVTLDYGLGPKKLAGWVDLDKVQIKDVAAVSGQVVDVRTLPEFEKSHIDGAINIHVDDIISGAAALDKSRPVFVYCATGGRSRKASYHLDSMGYDVTDLGGWEPPWSTGRAHRQTTEVGS